MKKMFPTINLSNAPQEIKDNAYEYMAVRSTPGPFFIISFFLLFVYISPIYQDQPNKILFIGIALILTGIFRGFNEFGFKKTYPRNKKRWAYIYSISVSLTALIWGIFCLVIVTEYGINWISLLVLVYTAGLSSAGIIAVIPHFSLSFTFQSFILLPTAVFSFTLDTAAAYSISYMFISYLIFMSIMSFNLHKEYWVSVQNVILLDERAKELEIARDNAIKLADAKTAFLTTMSHELRTPMNGILGMTQLLKLSRLDKEQEEYISTINSSTNLLLTMINDILDHSRMELGKGVAEHHYFNLNILADEVYQLLKPVTDEKKLNFNINIQGKCPTDLIGDEGKIRQILLNLLGNAIKFTKHGSININIKCKKDGHDKKIQFTVSDTGIGISPDKHDLIFSDFTQADNSITRQYGGTGLGLSISKQLVTLMNGNIGIQSKVNVGSSFWFEIPLINTGVSTDTNTQYDEKNTQTKPDFILNPQTLTQLKKMMEDQYPQLIESHISSSSKIIKHIQQCIENNDSVKLQTYLNSLKSASASIGAKTLEAELDFVEKNLAKNIFPSKAEYQKILHLFNETISVLRKEIA